MEVVAEPAKFYIQIISFPETTIFKATGDQGESGAAVKDTNGKYIRWSFSLSNINGWSIVYTLYLALSTS